MTNLKLANFKTFEQMIAPDLIRILYWIGLVLIGIGGLVQLVQALGAMGQSFLTGLGLIVGTVLGVLLTALILRVTCEMWIVLFGIYERLGDVRDTLNGPDE